MNIARDASSVMFRRLFYFLSPQLDLYEKVRPIVAGKTVLEVGFGTGIGVMQLTEAAHVTAIEIDDAAVRFAERCFPLPNVEWAVGDIETFRNGRTYDLISMIEVIEHTRDPRLALNNCRRLMTDWGQMLITTPNALRYRRRAEALNNREWTPLDFKMLLGDHFDKVDLLDGRLDVLEDLETRESPIIALCS